ncbi:hypothetical protein J4219_03365 [Candidatus Woesearchaeota archaeon]|nr:hypothetical protein [Candidatus Woesearchaeota archaeon]
MDVDKLQRINALAGELRKRNMTFSSDDAYKQAEQVYEQGLVQEMPMQETVVLKPVQDMLETRKIELMLELNNKKYEAEFERYRSAINTLALEIQQLKEALSKATFEAPKQKEKQAELKTEVKEDHPRQGKYQPADVDIQKMFYFGSKR